MGFSVEKMDRTADPRKDFVRYAEGRWIDAAVIPLIRFLRQVIPTDPHPPGLYRVASPSRQYDAFYEALGIKAGDAMWTAQCFDFLTRQVRRIAIMTLQTHHAKKRL